MSFRTPDEIYFRCSACRGRLGAERAAIGRLVECPACQASLLVPERSTVWAPAWRRLVWILCTHGVAVVALSFWALHLMSRPDRPVPAAAGTAAARPAELAPVRTPGGPARPGPVAVEGTGSGERAYRDLQSAHRAMNRQYEDLANWVLNNMRGRFLLKERFVKNISVPPLTDAYQLHPDLAEFLEVSPQEQNLLEDAFGFGLSSMAALETKFLSVTQAVPGQVSLHIPPYVEEGAAMQSDLYRAMETVLGAARFGRLLTASEKDLIQRYHYFGAASRTMVFEHAEPGDGSEPPYLVIRDGWTIPDGPGKRSIQVAEIAVRELPKDYLPYLSWLPEFVTGYASP